MNENTKSLINNAVEAATDVNETVQSGKKWYSSRTLWANVLASVAIGVQAKTGYVIDPSLQALGLAGINMVLRAITKEALV